jgi:hypothetical protein
MFISLLRVSVWPAALLNLGSGAYIGKNCQFSVFGLITGAKKEKNKMEMKTKNKKRRNGVPQHQST